MRAEFFDELIFDANLKCEIKVFEKKNKAFA